MGNVQVGDRIKSLVDCNDVRKGDVLEVCYVNKAFWGVGVNGYGVLPDKGSYLKSSEYVMFFDEAPTIEQLLTKASKHAAKAAKHEQKRAALIEQAREMLPKGYELNVLGEVVKAQPAEDMSDPNNWQVGDVVVSRCDRAGGYGWWFDKAAPLRVVRHHGSGGVYLAPIETNAHQEGLFFNYKDLADVEWISRPNKGAK